MMRNIKIVDPEVAKLIAGEERRQREGLEMIPSENYVSKAVSEAVGSVLENKYAEGYPRKRYYTGNEFVDPIEQLCIDRAKKLFGVEYVNVQPYSGSPANLEIFGAICEPGKDVVLSQLLTHGGHLSMGQEASFTSKYYKAVYYHLTNEGEIDWKELLQLARDHKPKIIWAGGTAYTKIFRWEKYAEIADEVGAFFVADISHIGGLVAGGAHPSPVPFAHVIMTTTHKTLRGPRGAMIMLTKKGMEKDPDLKNVREKNEWKWNERINAYKLPDIELKEENVTGFIYEGNSRPASFYFLCKNGIALRNDFYDDSCGNGYDKGTWRIFDKQIQFSWVESCKPLGVKENPYYKSMGGCKFSKYQFLPCKNKADSMPQKQMTLFSKFEYYQVKEMLSVDKGEPLWREQTKTEPPHCNPDFIPKTLEDLDSQRHFRLDRRN
jgi:hypothetical protein